MNGNTLDIITVIAYFVVILGIGFWSGRGKQNRESLSLASEMVSASIAPQLEAMESAL